MSVTVNDALESSTIIAENNPAPEDRRQPNLPLSSLPSLESGDRLTRAEFHRRYTARPDIKKAELIEGIVYVMSSPLSLLHARPHASIIAWLKYYQACTPGVETADNATVLLDADNEPQPDVSLRISERYGGLSKESASHYIEGPPELIVEIAVSSASNDLHDKKLAYRRRGVREYIVWRVRDEALDWFVLEDDAYHPVEPDARGVIESRVFPGLRLSVPDLLADRHLQVIEELQRGLDSDAHRAFVEKLRQTAARQ